MEARMILQDPPVENPCFDSRSLRLSSSQTGAIEEGNSGGFPTGYAGCGKPLFKVGDVGDLASLRTRNQQRVTRPVETLVSILNSWGYGLPRQVKSRQVTTAGFPQGWKRVSHSPCFNTQALDDDYRLEMMMGAKEVVHFSFGVFGTLFVR